jgi:phosphonate transport system substrate-binding protein
MRFARLFELNSKKQSRHGARMRQVATLMLTLLGSGAGAAVSAEAEFILGVLPRHTPSETAEMYRPLAAYLSHELGTTVKVETTADFKSFWTAVAAGRYRLVHYNQYHYVRAHKELGHTVIAKNEELNRSAMGAAIVIRKDSGIKSLADLRGKKIIFGGDRQALMSYIIPTYLLRQAGLNAGDYSEEFTPTPPNVALTVFFRRADAGGVADIALDMPFVREKIDVTQMVTLTKSEPVAYLPWAVRGDVPAAERERIQKLLLGVKAAPEGSKIFKAAVLTNLVSAKDEEYSFVRSVIKTVTSEQY